MRLTFCAACGDDDPDHLEHHHLVPRSLGGGDEESNLITLCRSCHGRAHAVDWNNDLRSLIREGRRRARERGVRFGRAPKLTRYQRLEALARMEAGERLRDIALTFSVSHPTISRLRSDDEASEARREYNGRRFAGLNRVKTRRERDPNGEAYRKGWKTRRERGWSDTRTAEELSDAARRGAATRREREATMTPEEREGLRAEKRDAKKRGWETRRARARERAERLSPSRSP